MTPRPWVLLLALVTGLTLAAAAPAQGDLVITTDDSSGHDTFVKVAVRHADNRVRIKDYVLRRGYLPEIVYHPVDVRGTSRPEFLITVIVKNEVSPHPHVSVKRVHRWPPRRRPWRLDGTYRDCGLQTARKRHHTKVLRIKLGRGCFRLGGRMPRRLRVNTFGGYVEFPQTYDPFPARRTYGDWVKAG